ncbi:M23 family metallopeptidase [Brevundimonas sp.]|uniref:M23 family metallopeptidase n=1 Tax=Brevundimonas sp. TaxID=1871086 RepID=UPI002AB89F8F|nr:M23 family metallopeptidase [Brevundimonas sp.]MDZ4364055.1 M23 family metallopeptidase [Brevundimonas sp.]
MRIARRSLFLGAAGSLAVGSPLAVSLGAGPGQARQDPGLELSGRFVQGGHAIGRTWPRALIFVDGEALVSASADGWFFVGFDRDAPASVEIEIRAGERSVRQTLTITPGSFPSSRIDGLPTATVDPTDPALQARIQREVALKTEGFASRTDADDFRAGFSWPLDAFRVTSRWGSQRILNGTPARPHYGIDMAAPQGTPIRAPAAGLVTLAQPNLHFEGGLILIDHGQGVITAYLHQSHLEVAAGRRVMKGEILGHVGMTGRATGPHLCWRMKWRDRNVDPSLMVAV